MSANEYIVNGLADIERAASWILKKSAGYSLIAFYGELGAGKTTLIQEICRQEGVEKQATSPTFALVNEYVSKDNRVIFHFDFYRLEDPEEVFDIGFEEYISSGNRCLMEWPDKIEPFLPEETLRLYIDVLSKISRIIRIEYPA